MFRSDDFAWSRLIRLANERSAEFARARRVRLERMIAAQKRQREATHNLFATLLAEIKTRVKKGRSIQDAWAAAVKATFGTTEGTEKGKAKGEGGKAKEGKEAVIASGEAAKQSHKESSVPSVVEAVLKCTKVLRWNDPADRRLSPLAQRGLLLVGVASSSWMCELSLRAEPLRSALAAVGLPVRRLAFRAIRLR